MCVLESFTDELLKIASEADYRTVKTEMGKFLLQAGIPVIRKLPQDQDAARAKIEKAINKGNVKKVLGYSTVAIDSSAIPDLRAFGFKASRLAVPLPGKRVGEINWRAGRLHAHKAGPLLLVHQDKKPVKGLSAVAHLVAEGVPAVYRRYLKEKEPIVKELKNVALTK